MSCLIIKNDGIGDLILSSGLISAIGKHFNGNVDLVTCSANREIAEGIEPLRKRYYVSRDGMHFSGFAAKLGLLIPRVSNEDKSVLRALGKNHYEMAISLRRFIRQSSLIIMNQVNASKKYCSWQIPTNASWKMAERYSRGWEHYSEQAETLSEQSYFMKFLENVFNEALHFNQGLSFLHEQSKELKTHILALGISGSSTNWPSGYWIELAIKLIDAGWKLVILGGKDVETLGKHIANKVPDVNNQVGKLNWRKTAEVLSSCEAYIGNDTGLSHLASLVVGKCLIIMGGGTFRRFFPWPFAVNQYIIFHGLECFDCEWNCKYHDHFCMSLVRPGDVALYFHEIMSGHAKSECDLNPENVTYQLSWRRRSESYKARARID